MPQLDLIMYSSGALFLWVFLIIFTEIFYLFIKYLYSIMRTKTLYIRNLYRATLKTFKNSSELNDLAINKSAVIVKQLSMFMSKKKQIDTK